MLLTENEMLRNLLAVIHRDGGHYTEENGISKSFTDALVKLNDYLKFVQEKD